jgi:MinD superfamily P-loop ATPase
VNIVIASGKGGTGKTTIATNLALSVPNSVYLDCDVEEPNGHLFLNPIIEKTETIYRLVPEVDNQKCTYCGECANLCEYNALIVLKDQILVFNKMCHSCGVCNYFCPEDAIREIDEPIGTVRRGKVQPQDMDFIGGSLAIGEMSAGPLIDRVKKYTLEDKLNIIDAPPGTACSMVETIRGVDYCLLVTEPTPFGLHDLKLAVKVVRIVGIPFGIVINKFQKEENLITDYCETEDIPVLMEIPFDLRLAEAYSRGQPAVKIFPQLREEFRELAIKIELKINKHKNAVGFHSQKWIITPKEEKI